MTEVYKPRSLGRGGARIFVLRHVAFARTPLNRSVETQIGPLFTTYLSSCPGCFSLSLGSGDPEAYHFHLVSHMEKLRHNPCASTGEHPVHSLCFQFQQSPERLKRKLAKLRILAPCQLPAPRTWAGAGRRGPAATAAAPGNRDVTPSWACRSPQARLAVVYFLSAGGVSAWVHTICRCTPQLPQLRSGCSQL